MAGSSFGIKAIVAAFAAAAVVFSGCTTIHNTAQDIRYTSIAKTGSGPVAIINDAFRNPANTTVTKDKAGHLVASSKDGGYNTTFTLSGDGKTVTVSIVPLKKPGSNFRTTSGVDNPAKMQLVFTASGDFVTAQSIEVVNGKTKATSVHINGAEYSAEKVKEVTTAIKCNASARAYNNIVQAAINAEPTEFSHNAKGNPSGIFRGKNYTVINTVYKEHVDNVKHILVWFKTPQNPADQSSALFGRVLDVGQKVAGILMYVEGTQSEAKAYAVLSNGSLSAMSSIKLTDQQVKAVSERARKITEQYINNKNKIITRGAARDLTEALHGQIGAGALVAKAGQGNKYTYG